MKWTLATVFEAVDKMTRPVESMKNSVDKLGSSASKAGKGVGSAGKVGAVAFGAVLAVGAAAVAVGAKFVTAGAEVEKYKTQLKVMLGSQDAANKRFDEMAKFAASTPFELPDVVQLGNQLQALGRYSKENMTNLGDLAAASGKPIEQVTGAFAKLVTGQKGVAVDMFRDLYISTDDWVKATGKGIDKSGSLLATAEEMAAVLPKILATKGFTGMMKAQSETFEGRVSNMNDAIGQFSASVGAALLGPTGNAAVKLGNIMVDLTSKVGANQKEISAMAEEVLGVFDSILGAIIPLIGPVMGVLKPIFSLFSKIMKGLVPIIQKFAKMLEKALPLLGALAETVGVGLGAAFFVLGGVLEIVFNVLGALFSVLTPVITKLGQLANVIIGTSGIIPRAWGGLVGAAKVVWGGISTFFGRLWAGIVEAVKWHMELFGRIGQAGVDVFLSAWAAVGEFFRALWDGLTAGFRAAMDWILTAIKPLMDLLSTIGDNLQSNISVNGTGATMLPASAGGTPISSNTTTTRRSVVDVNFPAAPQGTTIKQSGAAPGVTLNLGPAATR